MHYENMNKPLTPADIQQLAIASVMVQPADSKRYSRSESLAQGTLFPSLNLPFRLALNGKPVPVTPISELQALDFVVLELGLYLDTHPADQEAFGLFRKYETLAKEARARYEANYGPLTQRATANSDNYTWVLGPWPWENQDMKEEK